MNNKRIQEWEGDLITIENDILPDLHDQLAVLTDPNYKPEENADDEFRDRDIEVLKMEINANEKRAAYLRKETWNIRLKLMNTQADNQVACIERITVGELVLNNQTRSVELNDRRIPLTQSEYKVLYKLMVSNKICSYQDLFFLLHSIRPMIPSDQMMIISIIVRLRRKIGKGLIMTKRREGYFLRRTIC